jgi:hypothetical protein
MIAFFIRKYNTTKGVFWALLDIKRMIVHGIVVDVEMTL